METWLTFHQRYWLSQRSGGGQQVPGHVLLILIKNCCMYEMEYSEEGLISKVTKRLISFLVTIC